MWPNSNESPDFFLFANIQNLAQLLLVPELSSFTVVLPFVELAIIQEKTETSFKNTNIEILLYVSEKEKKVFFNVIISNCSWSHSKTMSSVERRNKK